MKCGKLAQSVYERSVIKVMKANGAGLGEDCAVLAGSGNCAGILSGQAAAFGMDSRTAARAYLAATNQVVSAALVAQRQVDEEAVATAELADGKPKIPPAGPDAGKARPLAESDATAG